MIRPKNRTDSLLSITKNCETLINQTHTKSQETLEFKMIKPRETFHFNPPIPIEGSWMIGVTSLEVYNSIFNITEENNKLELYKFSDEKSGGVSYEKVRDEIEKDLDFADITATNLQHDVIGPIIIKEYREQVTKKTKDDEYKKISGFYVLSIFQEFESYLRTEIDLIEDDIKLVLDDYSSKFITYEWQSGVYTFNDLPQALSNILQPEYEGYLNAIDINFDNTMRTRLVVRRGIIAIKPDENSIFSTLLGFNTNWDYKNYNEYTSQKNVNLSSTKKIHLKGDVIGGSITNGLRQPILSLLFWINQLGTKYFVNQKQYTTKRWINLFWIQ